MTGSTQIGAEEVCGMSTWLLEWLQCCGIYTDVFYILKSILIGKDSKTMNSFAFETNHTTWPKKPTGRN